MGYWDSSNSTILTVMRSMAKLRHSISTICSLLCVAVVAGARSHGEVSQSMDQYLRQTYHQSSVTITKLQVYIQAYFSTSDAHNQTVYPVAQASVTANSPTNFGQVIAIDNLVAIGPDPESELVGRYQGMNTYSDFAQTATTMNMNMVFSDSHYYGGSTLSIVGRQPIYKDVRVLSIAGGTGFFRLAKGTVLASTHSFDPVKRIGTYLYDMYVVTPTQPRAQN